MVNDAIQRKIARILRQMDDYTGPGEVMRYTLSIDGLASKNCSCLSTEVGMTEAGCGRFVEKEDREVFVQVCEVCGAQYFVEVARRKVFQSCA